MLFRSYVGLVSEDLVGLMAPAEAADPSTLMNAGLANDGVRSASRDSYHLLLHLTTGPALDRVVNCGDGEGLRAWHSIVERFDPTFRSRSAGILLETHALRFQWRYAFTNRGVRTCDRHLSERPWKSCVFGH